MQLLNLVIASAVSLGVVRAVDSSDVAFFTALVEDLKSNQGQYMSFVMTANSIPPQVTSLAMRIRTYTDDAYTTLLQDTRYDVTSLQDFATELPWYSRIQAQAYGTDASETTEGSEATITSLGTATNTDDTTTLSETSTQSITSDETLATNAGATVYYGPMGAIAAVAAVVLL